MRKPFFVAFECADATRLARLQGVFAALKAAKETARPFAHKGAYWRSLFDAASLEHFANAGRPSNWIARLRSSLAPILRSSAPAYADRPWDFDSMIYAFENGEYGLVSCAEVTPSVARLEFEPHSWPYGGFGCMVALIESFGFAVTDVPDI